MKFFDRLEEEEAGRPAQEMNPDGEMKKKRVENE